MTAHGTKNADDCHLSTQRTLPGRIRLQCGNALGAAAAGCGASLPADARFCSASGTDPAGQAGGEVAQRELAETARAPSERDVLRSRRLESLGEPSDRDLTRFMRSYQEACERVIEQYDGYRPLLGRLLV